MSIHAERPKLIVYGDIATDVTVQTGHKSWAKYDVPDSNITLLPGGSAANCAIVAARLGTPVDFVGVTGSDHLAQMLVEDMSANSVGIRYLRQTGGPTAVIVVIINPEEEQRFYSYRGAAASVPYGPIPPDIIRPGDCLHLSGYSFQDTPSRDTALALIDRATAVGAVISLNPSFHSAHDFESKFRPIMSEIDVVIPNSEEARQMTGEDAPEQAAEAIRAFGPQTVVITLGADGCYLASEVENTFIPAYPAEEVVDTTGAGDAFCGGFLTGILRGMKASDAARLAQAAATRIIAQVGGHTGAPSIEDIVQLMRQQGDHVLASGVEEVLS